MRYERADVVVVGGGLSGCLVAWRAVERRLSVVMVEQGRPRDPAEPLPLRLTFPDLGDVLRAGRSLPLWRTLEDLVGERFLQPCSSVELAPRNQGLEERYEVLLAAGRPAELLPMEELRGRHPRFTGPLEALGLVQPEGALVTPSLDGLWRRLQKMGVNIVADTAIRRLDLEYDQPTAVAADTAFRGRFLVAAAGLSTPGLLELASEPERCRLLRLTFACRPEPLPLFALPSEWGPVRGFSPGPGTARCRWAPKDLPEERPERFLADTFRRWLPELSDPPLESDSRELQSFPDSLHQLDFRPDMIGFAGVDLDRVGLSPALADEVLDEVTQATPARG